MIRAGEHLYLSASPGDPLELAHFWHVEVDECVAHDKPLPHRAVAISLAPLTIRDLTREFEAAVAAAQRPEAGVPSSYVIREGRAA